MTAETNTHIGRYIVERKLSEGGMAEVFLARTRKIAGFDKRVVIKSILPGLQQDESFAEMLLNEARIAAGLDHGNIVQVVDLVEEQSRHFIVMEFLDGQNLRQLVRRAIELGRCVPVGIVCRIVADVLSGLAYAHALKDPEGRLLGLVHRDVSLANIVVTYAGSVKLIDFGVAKLTTDGNSQLTRAGQLKGKCAYMSPEQILCEPLDQRTDLFSIGVVLWEMLTQRRLFARESDVATLKAVCESDATAPSAVVPSLPPRLDEICLRALARDRETRFQTADEMRSALEELILAQVWNASPLALQREMASLFRSETASALATPPPAQTVVLDDEELQLETEENSQAEQSEPLPPPPIASAPQMPVASAPQMPVASAPQTPVASAPRTPVASAPRTPVASAPPTSEEDWATPNPDAARPLAQRRRPDESAEITLLQHHNEATSVYDSWPADKSTYESGRPPIARGMLFAGVLVMVAAAVLVAILHWMPKGAAAALLPTH
jgi:serine/threonine-protein kinase